MGDYKYKAFISYSHHDRKWTRWLHKRLETYPIPKSLAGKVTSAGVIPRRLKPIFRDREELSVSNNLGQKIETALASSENLIVICSPAAAKSKWVNQEILTFKRNNRGAQLFSVIVEGEPYASTLPGREDEECFPPALRYEVNLDGSLSDTPAEPLAADLRPHADGKRLGALKLLSGLIGVGLDEVVQRDMKRSRARVTAITTGSLATVLAMGTLTGFAIEARQEAEKRRVAAEGLIEFMLGDLRDNLEPVGRLDVLDNVAKEVLSYYADQKTPIDCKNSRGKARAHYLEARIAMDRRKFDDAYRQAQRAHETLTKFLSPCLSNPQFIVAYTHAQQWLAEPNFEKLRDEKRKSQEERLEKGRLTDIEKEVMWNDAFQNYQNSEDTLKNLSFFEESSLEYLLEMTDVDILFAKLFRLNKMYVECKMRLASAEARLSQYFEDQNPSALLLELNASDRDRIIDKYADLLTYISENAGDTENYELAVSAINTSQIFYERLARPDGLEITNWNAQFGVLGTKYSMARINVQKENPSAALDVLRPLVGEVRTLRNNDLGNLHWQQFEENVLYSIKRLSIE